MRIYRHARIPIEPEVFSFGMLGFYGFVFVGIGVEMVHIAALPHGIAFAGFIRNGGYIETVAEEYFLPFVVFYGTSFPMKCGTDPTAVVLQAAVYIVGNLVVDIDMIKLSYRNILGKAPGFTAVIGYGDTAVVAVNDIVGIFWMYQKGMVVGVYGSPIGQNIPMFAGIAAVAHLRPNGIHAVFDLRVGIDFVVVKGPIACIGVIGYVLPIFAPVITAVKARFFSFDDGVNAVGT